MRLDERVQLSFDYNEEIVYRPALIARAYMRWGLMADCECSFCKNNKDFVFPRELLARMSEGKVAIFAGAGISTENRDYCRDTFYDQIRNEVGASLDLDFPSLMSLYCGQPDGRIKLVQKIRDRIS